MDVPAIARSLALFVVAGLLEIGGGYLVWLWLRDGRGIVLGAIGGLILFVYGVIPTLQPSTFGRTYAAYGGFFIVLSLLWGWWVDRQAPDRWDLIGAAIALGGVLIVFFAPRPAP
jgi:small multidrug resistance family-3 protein